MFYQTPKTMKITFSQKKDATRLARLNQFVQDWHYEHYPKIFKPYHYESILPWYQNILANENNHAITVFDGKKAIGFVLLMHKTYPENPFIQADFEVLLIDQMAIDKTYQNKGIGTLLMEEVIAFSKARNIERIRLTVWTANQPAIHFYEKMGFSCFMKSMEWR